LVYIVSGYDQNLFDILPTIDVSGRLRFKLRQNVNGPVDLQVRLRDGGGDNESAPQPLRLIVKPVNDPPSFTVGPDITIREDAGPQVFPGRITNISPGAENERLDQTVEFIVETDNPSLFTAAGQPRIDADGKIRFHAAPNANGVANLSIIARDILDEVSAVKPFRIVVNAVNDPPSFIGRHVTAFINTGLNVIPSWATEIDVGAVNESDQRVFFFTSPQLISNLAIFANADGQPSVTPDGTLAFTLAAGVAGSTTFTMVLFDTGAGEGIGNFTKSFTLTVGLEGETNGDGRVDITDLNNVRNSFGAQSSNGAPVPGDTYPIDGRVDIKDLNAVRNQFGTSLTGAPVASTRHTEQLLRQRAADLLFQNWQAAATTTIRPAKSRR
jgi:hypothetical protein